MVIYVCLDSMFSKIYIKLFIPFLIILCCCVFCFFYSILEIKHFSEGLFLFIVSIEGILLILSPFFFLYKRVILKRELQQQENDIPKYDDISYFRDKVGRISPGVLTFVLNKKIKYEDSIMASIFSLLHRKYVKIENDKLCPIEVSKDDLDSNEKYILDSYKFIFSTPQFKAHWNSYVIDDSINLGYIERNKQKMKIMFLSS